MDFKKDVIEVSNKQPVLVDFWAEWCGPCQFIGPVLEKLEGGQSRWKLVKVNVDENPEISQQFGIRGIPDVRLFVDGKVKGQFTGAKPQHEIEKWLNDLIPDERLEKLNVLIEQGKTDQLEKFVKDNPDLEIGRIALAKIVVWENPGLAKDLIQDMRSANEFYDTAGNIRTIVEFLDLEFKGDSKVETLLNSAKIVGKKQFDKGMDHIIRAVMTDKTFQNDLPRRLAIALFGLLGPGHEVTKKYRRRFDMALY